MVATVVILISCSETLYSNASTNLESLPSVWFIFTILRKFPPLEAVDRGGETQLQVGENFNWIATCEIRSFHLVSLPASYKQLKTHE